MNPRPKKHNLESPSCVSDSDFFKANLYGTGKNEAHSSLIDLGLLLQAEALDLSCQMTLTSDHAGLPTGAAT